MLSSMQIDCFRNSNKYYVYSSGKPLRKKMIPDETRYLIFENYNHPIDNCIPKNVILISFGNYFNQPINKNSIPDGVLYLYFGKSFNQSIENIPSSVIHLSLDWNYGLETETYNYVMQNDYYYKKIPFNLFCTFRPIQQDLERDKIIMNMINDLADVNFIQIDDENIGINEYLHITDIDEIVKNNLNDNVLTTEKFRNSSYWLSRYIIHKISKEYLPITQNSFEESLMFIPNSVLKHLEIIEIKNYEFYKINKMRLKTKKVIYNKYKYRTDSLPLLYKNKNFESIFSDAILHSQEFASKISEELTSVVFNPERIMMKAIQNNMSFEEYYESL